MERASLGDRWAYGRPHQPFITQRKRRWSGVAAMTAIFMALAGVALADNIQNDVVVSGNDTITAGGSTDIKYWIDNTSAGGATFSTCDAADGSAATVTITAPPGVTLSGAGVQGATANIRLLTFNSCGTSTTNTQTVTFSSSVVGSHAITTSVSDTRGNYNPNSANFTLNVNAAPPPADTTPPDISYILNPASPDGSNDWYKSNVTLTWTVTENESPGSLVKTGCVDQIITADQAETSYSCSATSDGGSAGPVNVSIKRDATQPTVSLVGGPTDGASYYFGSVPAAPTCSASDATSGLAGACSVSGYGTTVGPHTVTASAEDNAGNTNSASATYTVLAWTLNGFYQPVDMNGVVNTVKGGSTVPMKFEVFAGATELTATSVLDTFSARKVSCTALSGDPLDEIEYLSPTNTTGLRYDTTGGQFIYNWQTPKAAGVCYAVTLTTDDGSQIGPAYFKTK